MTTLDLQTLRLPVADLGAENPLPLLFSARELHDAGAVAADDGIPADMRERLRYGHPVGVYPYLEQDGYRRDLVDRDVRVAVLQNDVLAATFLLDYGGRLWSLVHRPTGRDLLFNPGHIRLANLALRNAWFAGGVEWNIGTTGHSPTTCAPLHAAQVEGPGGEPVLRLYEYERLRGVVFQVDAWLPDGSSSLKVHVRIQNPNPHDVPMYWWSNVAVAQGPDVRVVAPADTAWFFGYERTLDDVPMPHHGGVDVSYPSRAKDAADYFFRLRDGDQPWIAALDGHGSGLVQASTRRLAGRKLFRWGTGPGGRRWQDWLGSSDRPYLEIQAGLAQTQLEHVRLPAGESWSWVEAYALLDADPEQVHGTWGTAQAAVEEALARVVAPDELEQELAAAASWADAPPTRLLHRGSGWGALEQRRRRVAGEPAIWDRGTPFQPETLGPDQEPWVALLDSGRLPSDNVPPAQCVHGGDWADRLAGAPTGWLSAYLQGLLAHAGGDSASASSCYTSSLRHRDTPWALRGLALLARHGGHDARAAELYRRAHELARDDEHLAKETAAALLRADRPTDALEVVQGLPQVVRSRGRFQLLEAQAAAAGGDLGRARAILDAGLVVDDLREGEAALDSLWDAVHPGVPVPAHYDFRMRAT